jgi:hypothetical protein
MAGDTIPGCPEIRVLALEKGSDEIILRSEVPVKARFRHPGLLDDEINTNRPHAAFIKECARSIKDSFPHRSVTLGVRQCLGL